MAFLCGGSAEERCRLDMTSKQEAIISGEQIKNMLLGAYKSFEKNYQYINDLNVFPVPDGDTGTNMMHTMAAVAREISQLQNATVSEVGTMAARSAIMGARGNSGVILSQLLRGLGKGLAGKKRATSNEVGKAFQFGILYAYRAVSKPVEGTILTVARAIAKGAYHAVRQGEDFEDVLCEALESGKKELARTPELLPALKAAGVVDAGGQGLIVFLEGCLAGFRGEDAGELHLPPSKPSFANFIEMEVDLENPYCTEFIVKEAEVKEDVVRSTLQPLGNSLIVAVVGDIVKVHIHTKAPGLVLQHGLSWGSLHDIKIDNMAEQHQHRVVGAQTEKHGLAVLSVAAGNGIASIMHQLGAAEIISGGQSMNPPVEAFIKVIEKGSAEQYIILPNNKNIILAAEQAKSLSEDTKVYVVPSKTVPQGITALINFAPDLTAEENMEQMSEEMSHVKTGQITYAVRNTSIDGMEIAEGDIMGIGDSGMLAVGKNIEETAIESLRKMVDDESELVTIYYGEDVTEEDAEAFCEKARKEFTSCEFECQNGGQPIYYYMISVE